MTKGKNILLMVLAVVVGLFVGGLVNMWIIGQLPNFFPYPDGLDPSRPEDIATFIKNAPIGAFVMVWLAHWGQAFFGGIVAALIAPKNKLKCALIVGLLSLAGGVAAIFMIPSPIWNVIVDLIGYLPAAWLGAKLASVLFPSRSSND